jgi:hypothetical protein
MVVDHSRDWFILDWWPSSSAWSGGVISWYGVYGSPAVCRWRELIVSRILGRNQRPMVPGVSTPTVAPEPSVERVAGASYSTVGGTGSHMVLWALPRDSTVRLSG